MCRQNLQLLFLLNNESSFSSFKVLIVMIVRDNVNTKNTIVEVISHYYFVNFTMCGQYTVMSSQAFRNECQSTNVPWYWSGFVRNILLSRVQNTSHRTRIWHHYYILSSLLLWLLIYIYVNFWLDVCPIYFSIFMSTFSVISPSSSGGILVLFLNTRQGFPATVELLHHNNSPINYLIYHFAQREKVSLHPLLLHNICAHRLYKTKTEKKSKKDFFVNQTVIHQRKNCIML